MNAEAGTEQKMRKGQERDRSGASALDVHLDGHNVKRIGKSRLSRSIGIALAACILVSSPAQAAKTPLISGTESDSDSEADGPALEDGTITENSADNTIASQSGSYTEEQLADSVIEYGELEALVRRGNGTAVSADYSYQDSLAVYQEAYDAMISGARDMNYKADELEDADRAAAVIASSSVKSARRSSATGDAARKLRHQQIEEAESAASASADEQYAEIAALSLERDAAQAAYQSAEKTYGATQIKYQSGAINKATYLQGEASYLQKKAELETAEISLRTAYDAYEWMLKGVA